MILVFSKYFNKSALKFLISTSKIYLAVVPSLNSDHPFTSVAGQKANFRTLDITCLKKLCLASSFN
jgi:hypothetical protein